MLEAFGARHFEHLVRTAHSAEEFVQREAVRIGAAARRGDARLAVSARVDPDQRGVSLGEQRAQLLAVLLLDRRAAIRNEQHDARRRQRAVAEIVERECECARRRGVAFAARLGAFETGLDQPAILAERRDADRRCVERRHAERVARPQPHEVEQHAPRRVDLRFVTSALAVRADHRLGHAAAAVEHDDDLGALPRQRLRAAFEIRRRRRDDERGHAERTGRAQQRAQPGRRGVGRPVGRARIRERARAVVEQRQRGERQRPQQPRVGPVQMRQHGTPRSRSADSRTSESTLAGGGEAPVAGA